MTEQPVGVDAQMVAFDCPGCGETTGIETDDPESLESKIFECRGCGENVLLNSYVGDSE